MSDPTSVLTDFLIVFGIFCAPFLIMALWHDYRIAKGEDNKGDYIKEAKEAGVHEMTEAVLEQKVRELHNSDKNILRLDEREILSFFNMDKVPWLRTGHIHHKQGDPVIEITLVESLRTWGGIFVGWYRTDVWHSGYKIEIPELDAMLGEDVAYVQTDDEVGGGHGRITAVGISKYEPEEYEDSFGDTIRETVVREWDEDANNRWGIEYRLEQKRERIINSEDIIYGETDSRIRP